VAAIEAILDRQRDEDPAPASIIEDLSAERR